MEQAERAASPLGRWGVPATGGAELGTLVPGRRLATVAHCPAAASRADRTGSTSGGPLMRAMGSDSCWCSMYGYHQATFGHRLSLGGVTRYAI